MKKLLFVFASLFIFVSCNDDDAVEPTPVATRMDLLTGGDWMMISAVQTEEEQRVDLFAALPANAQDDIFRFNRDGKAVREEGATKEANNPDIVDTGNWSFMNEEQKLQVAFQAKPFEDQIVELTAQKLVLREINGDIETLTVFEAR